MLIKEIPASETLELRLKVLRPNGSLRDCEFAGDHDALSKHFGAFYGHQLIGITSVYKRCHKAFLGNGFHIRSMATLPEARGQGVGKALLTKAESYAFNNHADYVWANARTSAVNFYKKSEFDIGENKFIIEGVGPHVLISKFKR